VRRTVAVFTVSVVAVVMLVTGALPALAAANAEASCIGIGGSTETAIEGPGARADIAHEVIEVFAPEVGTTPGGVYSVSAQQHLGTIDACFG
jgi:hypothetical protein